MMKGVWFDNIHSYEDLNLVLSSVSIPPAQVKTNYIDIPGADGTVDLTEALGDVKFKDRSCSFIFTCFPYEDFEVKKKQVSNFLNGKRCILVLDKDQQYYWEGRCFVSEYASDKNLRRIAVTANVAPYKMKRVVTDVIVPAGTKTLGTLINGRRKVVPTITLTAAATIVFEGNVYNLGVGTHNPPDFVLKYGENQVTVTCEKPVKFTYREGDL